MGSETPCNLFTEPSVIQRIMDALACSVLSSIPFLIPIPIIWANIRVRRATSIPNLRKLAYLSILTAGFWSVGIVALTDKLVTAAPESDRIALQETRLIGWIGVFLFCFLGLVLFYQVLK